MNAEQEAIYDWTYAFRDWAVANGYVEVGFKIGSKAEHAIYELWRAGLSPNDASHAYFATKH